MVVMDPRTNVMSVSCSTVYALQFNMQNYTCLENILFLPFFPRAMATKWLNGPRFSLMSFSYLFVYVDM